MESKGHSYISLSKKIVTIMISAILCSIVITSLPVHASTTNYSYDPYFTATGSNSVSIPDNQELRLQQFSVSAWFRTTMNNNSLVAIIVNKGGFQSDTPGTPQQNYGIWITGSNQGVRGKVQAGFEDANGRDYFVTSPNTYNDGQWHYAVVTYDGSTLNLYVDGSLVSSLNTNGAIPATDTMPLTIGKNSLDSSRYFIGDIDEVRIYNRALTAQEVNDAYNNGVFASDGLVMYTSMPILLKNDEYYYDLLEHIKIAKKKIYLHVYQLQYTDYDSRPNTLLNELVNAKKRNVDVRVSFDDNSLNLDAIKAFLTQNNIPYKIKPPHAKIVVIDDKIAYVGSANWRVSSLTYNNELTIKTNNIYIISKLNTYLDNIWNTNGRWGYYDDSIYQEEFLTGGYYDAIKNTINNAKDKIRVIMKWWDSYSIDLNHRPSNLARALVDAKNRGVDVKVIVDDTVPSSVRNFLKNNGVHIKLDPKSGQSTHVKSILVDQIVFVGSHNWTEGNLGSGDASIKVYSTITEDFLYYFDNLWNTSNRYP